MNVRSMQLVRATIVFFGLVLTIWRGHDCLQQYLEYRAVSTVEMETSTSTLLPALTICPGYNAAYNETRLEAFGVASRHEYRKMGRWGRMEDMDHRQIFQEVALSLEEVVERVQVSIASTESGLQRGEWKLEYSGERIKLLQTRAVLYYLYGKCFEILLSHFNSTISDVSISTKVSAYVFVHLPGQFLNEDSYSKLDLSPGKLLFIELTYDKVSGIVII